MSFLDGTPDTTLYHVHGQKGILTIKLIDDSDHFKEDSFIVL